MPIIRDSKGRIKSSTGRPKGSKNRLTKVKENLLKILSKKLKKSDIKDIDINTLIRFAGAIMPREDKLKIAPDMDYIESIQAPAVETKEIEKAQEIDNTAHSNNPRTRIQP